MDGRMHFERNLLALASSDHALCKRLSAAQTTRERYRFLSSRNGAVVPAAVNTTGSARPMHSLVDPEREAQRLVETVRGGFLVLLGLGGGYLAEAALAREDIQGLLIVDFDADGTAELLASKDYVRVFSDPRCRLLIDPSEAELREALVGMYRPALSGGFAMLPLRPRTDACEAEFSRVSDHIKAIIDSISDDYGVQAYFGKRWFANIIRNVLVADAPVSPSAPVRRVAVTAAGPSLDEQMPLIKAIRGEVFLLATDTSLPALLDADLKPDAVVSIDCQHISYQHFMRGLPDDVPLYLDLASPPVVAARTRSPRFFSGGHPLTVYVSRAWRSFPWVDTSGGNVTYTAVALAEKLGAESIDLFGADFSYPMGAPYARGTYIHPFFRRAQTRLKPLEALFSSFVFRNESLKKETGSAGWRYETKPLVGYRERLERLARGMCAQIVPAAGSGAPIAIPARTHAKHDGLSLLGPGAACSSARTFLQGYADAVRRLPSPEVSVSAYLAKLDEEERDVFTTLLPAAAAVRKRENGLEASRVIEAVKSYSLRELERVISSPN